MFGGLLTKATFLHLICQKSRQGGGIDARWTATLFSVAKKTALEHLQQLVDDGDIIRDEIPWRTNAKKFYFRPSPRTELNYRNHVYITDYRIWMNAMMEG